MNISLILFQLTLLATVQLSVTQSPKPQNFPTITHIRDVAIEYFKQFLDSIPIFHKNVLGYGYLNEITKQFRHSKMADAAGQLATIIASPLGPLAFPYSIDFDLPSNRNNTYDYVIVGAGAAGATLAARLSEDPNVKVLLIEAGGQENHFSNIPVLAITQQKTYLDWQYLSTPQNRSAFGLNNNQIATARGKGLGGSTSINYMMAVRGNPIDYDRWQKLGCTGWNFSSLVPYFILLENSRNEHDDPGYHGTMGPMTVTEVKYRFPVDTAFLEGCRQYGLKIGDYNGADQLRFTYVGHYIRNGSRCSTGRAYLEPVSSRPNLDILLYSRVNKILFNDDKRAIGVEFTNSNKHYQAFASKKVIISAGGIATPQLLMLSGIGPRDQLKKFNISIVHEAPGVGKNMQDHPFTFVMFKTNFKTGLSVARLSSAKSYLQYEATRTGAFTTPGVNVNGFYRTKYAQDARPDIQILEFDYIIGSLPNFYLGYVLNLNKPTILKYFDPYSGSDGTMHAVTLIKPRSAGTVELGSSNPRDPPLINFNNFAHPLDLKAIVEGIKLVLNISRTPAMKAVGAERFNSTLDNCSHYPLDSDPYLECLAQTLTFTLWHSVGTAKMGSPNDPMAVVSPDLHVYGVKNLMVVDTSVIPEVPSGNTATPTIAMAERTADMLKYRVLRAKTLPFDDEEDVISDYVRYEPNIEE